MSCKRHDDAAIKKMLEGAVTELGDPVTIKRVATSSPGDPTKGVYPTYTFTFEPTRAVIESVTQTDILYPGGIFQIGDIKVQMREVLREVVYTVGNIGDRLIWNGTEYRVLGKRQPETLLGKTFLNFYSMRPVNQE